MHPLKANPNLKLSWLWNMTVIGNDCADDYRTLGLIYLLEEKFCLSSS